MVRPQFAVRRFTRRYPRKAQRAAGLPAAGLSPKAAAMRRAWLAFWAGKAPLRPTRELQRERVGCARRKMYRTSQGRKPGALRKQLRRLARGGCQGVASCPNRLRRHAWCAHHILERSAGGPHELKRGLRGRPAPMPAPDTPSQPTNSPLSPLESRRPVPCVPLPAARRRGPCGTA